PPLPYTTLFRSWASGGRRTTSPRGSCSGAASAWTTRAGSSTGRRASRSSSRTGSGPWWPPARWAGWAGCCCARRACAAGRSRCWRCWWRRSRWASPTSSWRCRCGPPSRTTRARRCCCSCWCPCWRAWKRRTDMAGGWRAYWTLTKPRVVALIVFTALVGMFLAVPGLPPLRETLLGLLGIWLAAASAAAINHVLDQRIDALMARTLARPLPTGGLRTAQAVAFAVVLGVASMLILWFGTNPLAAVLTFASLIGYAIVYTGWLKRATPQNIVIGGIAGAAPPL